MKLLRFVHSKAFDVAASAVALSYAAQKFLLGPGAGSLVPPSLFGLLFLSAIFVYNMDAVLDALGERGSSSHPKEVAWSPQLKAHLVLSSMAFGAAALLAFTFFLTPPLSTLNRNFLIASVSFLGVISLYLLLVNNPKSRKFLAPFKEFLVALCFTAALALPLLYALLPSSITYWLPEEQLLGLTLVIFFLLLKNAFAVSYVDYLTHRARGIEKDPYSGIPLLIKRVGAEKVYRRILMLGFFLLILTLYLAAFSPSTRYYGGYLVTVVVFHSALFRYHQFFQKHGGFACWADGCFFILFLPFFVFEQLLF